MDMPFGEIFEYTYGDASEDFLMDSFPQFSQLPPELRIMIWEAAVPRRALSLILDNDEELPVLPPPAIAHVCRESRKVFLKHYCEEPYIALGWFNHKTDIFIWQPQPDILFKLHWIFRRDNFFQNLTSLTLCDPCPFDWVEDLPSSSPSSSSSPPPSSPWDPIQAYSSWRLSADQDPTGMRFIFRFLQTEPCALRTLNIFNHNSRSRDSFTLQTSLLSPQIATLFGTDSALLVDHTNADEVARVAQVLETDEWDTTRACALGLTRLGKELSPTQRKAHWDGLRFDYKIAWLQEVYQQDRVRGLPDDPPDVVGWDAESNRLLMNWDEEDPVVKKCLAKMPEIRFVYVILTED
ncbi:uncharacterized protein F4807DRAFT_412917 [Annulohypoxylon truncatum]|uniref:uncharacterized protein n=1 Tax=Annulohypoxylon truncatum TaxID=327061 RepID=UPI002008CAA7|nr:uncharacterized protein F4807DRAFT_412917 [Annulohypoxylon truncatum]KAI1213093.1 hypothetical protein F4807DRAFT_412917 [Annulohypoxylon truncatum]